MSKIPIRYCRFLALVSRFTNFIKGSIAGKQWPVNLVCCTLAWTTNFFGGFISRTLPSNRTVQTQIRHLPFSVSLVAFAYRVSCSSDIFIVVVDNLLLIFYFCSIILLV